MIVTSLRITAILEGISYLGLFITMPIKYIGGNGLPNYIVGMAHGVLFVAYLLLVCIVMYQQKLSRKEFVYALIASLLPTATFFADYHIFRKLN
jgi:integral membrane protein